MAAMTVSAVSVRTIAAPKRVAVRKAAASRAQVRVCASASVPAKVKAAVEKAAVAGSLTLLAAAPAHASQTDEVVGFLKAFLEFRTKDPTSFLLLTVAPILVPYAIFSVLVGKKEIRRKEELAAGGWDKFMAERGLDIDTLKLPQLNAFAIAAEKDLLDDEMVREFVRQVELSEKWKKSTIDVADPRLENAKRRARAEKILALKEERAKQEASANN